MLKQGSRTPRQQNGIFIYSMCFMLSAITLLVNYIDSQLELGVTKYINSIFIGFMTAIFLSQITIWLIRNKANKGMKHAIYHYLTVLKLRKSFLDASYYNKRFYFNNEVADLPKIKVDFADDFSKAKLLIENININKDIGNVNISFALNDFIVDRAYLSNDENYHVFEIYDSNIDQQYKFDSFDELKELSAQVDDYTLLIDKSIAISLYGTLLVGQTGSGKTYALYSLILQMLIKNVHYNIYFADPKNSSLAVLGEKISKENTATDIDDIIELLKRFNEIMIERKAKIKEKLNMKLEGTYADFQYEPYIFIFDEFASFQTVLQTMEKKKRDEVMKLLSQVVLQGRQLGFFLWIVMQKSDATLLPTNLRENLPVKFVLGNAEKQTYTTAFGTGVDTPEKNFQLGQGVFTCPIVANTPKICHFSYLNFDILEAVNPLKT
ncbi:MULTISPECIES: FtsK/SpoIIIE domain-containing protein [Enterococcus]|uniref:FtsK/SpoIIIE domain-containing protein n=1 Tax=Enterococcus TaxID=1350 RepID=UPI00019CD048|nr:MULTISPECIES: FtsK/SpoIIIE domain-containing protein [Enterococcus]EEI59072.1 FtsK/SpoIIIE family protein [Enterococcus faecium TX1330]RIX95240.1 cell division protein FtsK [Enterococcus faecium TX1330]